MRKPRASIDSFISVDCRRKVQSLLDEALAEVAEKQADRQVRRLLHAALFPGRRLRPILFMSLAGSCPKDKNFRSLEDVAVAIELCHRGSIIMDDMIDEDRIRRGVPTFHSQFGTKITSLVVTILIAEATRLVRHVDNVVHCDLSSHFAITFHQMSVGELSDIGVADPDTRFLRLYVDRVLLKTASLFQFLFWAASKLSGYPDETVEQCSMAGLQIGRAYQIHNDLFDETEWPYRARGATSSKVLTLSLPIAIALDNVGEPQKSLILSSIGKRVHSKKRLIIQRIIQENHIKRLAKRHAAAHLRNTIRSVRDAKDLPAKGELINFCHWIKRKECWDQTEFENAGYTSV